VRLQLSSDSRVLIDLRATGLLRAIGHDPTLTARPDPVWFDVPDTGDLDVPVEVRFRTERIEAPEDEADREKMIDNMRGAEVLGTARFPTIDLRARYKGSLERGRLAGELVVRGSPRPVALDVVVAHDGYARMAKGTWSGRLTDLGIKPFKALMGALRLEDWIRIRVEARLVQEG
jgi:polyisoprenoid-binding protein YceI